jgi:hypothetical protein
MVNLVKVRKEYSEESEWRKSVGNEAYLLRNELKGYSLDAPTHIPAGAMKQVEVYGGGYMVAPLRANIG